MPFTLAHPAAVLPLMRRPMVGLALVCGALAPDLPYYVRATRLPVSAQSWYEPFTNATVSHSIAGLPTVTLLLALALYFLLLAATPPVLWLVRGRRDAGTDPTSATVVPDRADAKGRGWARWLWVPVSLLVGAATHLLWDSFASSDGFLAVRFDALNEPAVGDLTWVALLQHGSSVIGLVVLAVALWRHRRSFAGHAAPLRRCYWALGGLVAVGVVAGVASLLVRFDPAASSSTRDLLESAAAIALMGGGAAVGVVVVLATATWWLAQLHPRLSRIQ